MTKSAGFTPGVTFSVIDENEDISRDKCHVEDAACDKQHLPTPSKRQEEVEQRDNNEEYTE